MALQQNNNSERQGQWQKLKKSKGTVRKLKPVIQDKT